MLGIDLTALAVFSGAFGLAIGFGLQKTFGNLIAGIILLMDHSIKPGDVIAVNDGITNTVGQVKKIGIRAVSVTTRDKKEYLIPNENLMINQVENWSYSSRDVRIKVPVSVAYGTDLDLAERLMLEATTAAPRVLGSPRAGGLDHRVRRRRRWLSRSASGSTIPRKASANVRSDVLKGVWTAVPRERRRAAQPAQRDVSLRDRRAALHAS